MLTQTLTRPRWSASAEADIPAALFQRLLEAGLIRSSALVVFDANARAVYVSPAARMALRRPCVDDSADGGDPAESPRIGSNVFEWLEGALRRAARAGEEGPVIRCTHEGRELQLRVRAVPGGIPGLDGYAVLLIRNRNERPRVSHSVLRRTYGLTETEAALAAELACGASTRDFAAMRGMSVFTARTHLKRVFCKCGVNSQSELLREILLGFAVE